MDSVQIFFGTGGIKQIYEMSLEEKAIDIVCLSDRYEEVIGDYFEKSYSPRLYGKKTREILPDTPANRQAVQGKDSKKNQVKFVRLAQKSESDYILFGHKAALISYNKQSPFACLVTDPDLVANLRTQFENLWERL